jgi:hypothetical protein
MKASLTAIAALLALGLAAPAFAQTSAPAPAAPAVTAPAKKADHKTVAQAPKKDEHATKDGAKTGAAATTKKAPEKKSN